MLQHHVHRGQEETLPVADPGLAREPTIGVSHNRGPYMDHVLPQLVRSARERPEIHRCEDGHLGEARGGELDHPTPTHSISPFDLLFNDLLVSHLGYTAEHDGTVPAVGQ